MQMKNTNTINLLIHSKCLQTVVVKTKHIKEFHTNLSTPPPDDYVTLDWRHSVTKVPVSKIPTPLKVEPVQYKPPPFPLILILIACKNSHAFNFLNLQLNFAREQCFM